MQNVTHGLTATMTLGQHGHPLAEVRPGQKTSRLLRPLQLGRNGKVFECRNHNTNTNNHLCMTNKVNMGRANRVTTDSLLYALFKMWTEGGKEIRAPSNRGLCECGRSQISRRREKTSHLSLEETRKKEAWFLMSRNLQSALADRTHREQMIISRQKWYFLARVL
ncbi:Recq-Mediated Genome Instability Protein 1 [Manis pentadactyla]|nr:Recq-Mediated Genome Instability Protein 1 [Manis pentadactyla]